MANILENDFSSYGVPVHNPPYKSKKLWCRFDLAKLEVSLKHPEVIADLVPKPLEFLGESIFISANKVKDFKGDFAAYSYGQDWNEIIIQIPVLYNKQYYYYNCEIYTNNFGIISADRELFGFPRIAALVSIERDGKNVRSFASHYGGKKEICRLSFEPLREGTINDIGIRPRIINFKHIPSPLIDQPAEVKALIALKYEKQMLHEIIVGTGKVELLEWSPEYLKQAEIGGVVKALFMDIELSVQGGRIVFNYIK